MGVQTSDIASDTVMHEMQCMEIWSGHGAIREAVSVPGLDVWVHSRPYEDDDTGGDIHFISLCAKGCVTRLSVADVAGHGRPVSDIAEWLRNQMRRHIIKIDQSRFARAINKEFAELETEGRFATALLASYFAPEDRLILCNAGHPRPLWYRAEAGEWCVLHHEVAERDRDVRNLPLGIIDPTDYHQFAVTLAPGDLVVIYTDSLTEARAGGGDEMLGEQGLLALVDRLDATEHEGFGERVLDAVAHYAGRDEPEDDETLVVLRHTGVRPPRRSPVHLMKMMGKMLLGTYG